MEVKTGIRLKVVGGIFSKYFLSEWSMIRAKLKGSMKCSAFTGTNDIVGKIIQKA